MNIFYLGELSKWSDENDYPIGINIVSDPAYYRPDTLPLVIQNKISEKLRKIMRPEHMALINTCMGHEENPDSWKKFMQITSTLDSYRGESFKSTFPEFIQFLEDEGFLFDT
jgi:hypothetical protein